MTKMKNTDKENLECQTLIPWCCKKVFEEEKFGNFYQEGDIIQDEIMESI